MIKQFFFNELNNPEASFGVVYYTLSKTNFNMAPVKFANLCFIDKIKNTNDTTNDIKQLEKERSEFLESVSSFAGSEAAEQALLKYSVKLCLKNGYTPFLLGWRYDIST